MAHNTSSLIYHTQAHHHPKIGPKPFQKLHIPIYLGGFSSNTFSRIVKQDLNGWLGIIGGPLAQVENSKNATLLTPVFQKLIKGVFI